MQRTRRWLVLAGLLAAGLQLTACTQQTAEVDGATSEPATVEHVAGSDVERGLERDDEVIHQPVDRPVLLGQDR